MRHKPKTRRHTARTQRMVYTTYRGLTGETVTIPFLVNTGKQYNNPSHKWWEGLRDTMTTDATANQLDIRGHGLTTSRVKRTRRAWFEGIGQHYSPWDLIPTRLAYGLEG